MLIATIDTTLRVLAITGLPIIALIAALLIAKPRKGALGALYDDIKKNGLWLAFAIALIATLGSLFYSEIAHYTPCKLCWFQRILMYPLTITTLIAAIRKDRDAWHYIIPPAIIGGAVAVGHYFLQVHNYTGVCAAGGVDCAQNYSFYAGFVSIPFMALVAFTIITLMTLAAKKHQD